MFSLKSIAAMNLNYGQVMELPEPELAVFSMAMIEPLSKMDLFEQDESRRGLWNEFMRNDQHICRVERYTVRGLQKEVQGRAACWCYCPNGSICNCQCGAALTILMEYRENQIWRNKGPNIPKINRNTPIKIYLKKKLIDPQPRYNVNRRRRYDSEGC